MQDHNQAQRRTRGIDAVGATKTCAARFIGNWPDPMRKEGV
jgi:hypothetical protein